MKINVVQPKSETSRKLYTKRVGNHDLAVRINIDVYIYVPVLGRQIHIIYSTKKLSKEAYNL